MSLEPAFHHARLELDTGQIRLVQLVGRLDWDGELSTSIYELNDAPPFMALSYTWGSDEPCNAVCMNKQRFMVRDNLYDFLSIHAPLRGSSLFWIDQLSIDQSNVTEKNHQVQFMGDIFRRAELVIAWIGKEGRDSYQALNPISGRDLPRSLIYRRYWSRLWIIQELAVARKVEFACGASTFSWDQLRTMYNQSSYFKDVAVAVQICLWNICHVQCDESKSADWELADLLQQISIGKASFACQFPHDRIYGLMGLVKPPQRLSIAYENPIADVVSELMVQKLPRFEPKLSRCWRAYCQALIHGSSRIGSFHDVRRAIHAPVHTLDEYCRMLSVKHLIGTSCFRQLWLEMKLQSPDVQYLVDIDSHLTAILALRKIHTGKLPNDVCAIVEWEQLDDEARTMYKDYTFPVLVCWGCTITHFWDITKHWWDERTGAYDIIRHEAVREHFT